MSPTANLAVVQTVEARVTIAAASATSQPTSAAPTWTPAPAAAQPPAAMASPTPVILPGGSGVGAAPAAPAPVHLQFGVYGWSPDHPEEISAAQQAGMNVGEIAVSWRDLEFDLNLADEFASKAGEFHPALIGRYDSLIKAAADAGIEPLLLVVNPPDWAVEKRGSQGPLKPDQYGRFASFATRLAQRYGAAPYNVKRIVLFPEPDAKGTAPAGCTFPANHLAWGDAPVAFVEMLRRVYPAVKSARPDVQLVMGVLAYDGFNEQSNPCGAYSKTFLDDVVGAGGAAYTDALAVNAYTVFSVGWELKTPGQYDIAAKVRYLQAHYQALAGKPLLVLEAGTWSDPSAAIPVRMADGSVGTIYPTEDYQAAYPAKLFARAMSVQLGAVLWYGLKDADAPGGEAKRGLLDLAARPKKALAGYKQAVRRLSSASFERALPTGPAEGYVFGLPTGKLAIVWAVGDLSSRTRVSVDLPGGNVHAEDFLGQPVNGFQVSGDTVTLDVGFAPVFLLSGTA